MGETTYDIAEAVIKEYADGVADYGLQLYDNDLRSWSYHKWALEELRIRIINESLKLPPHISKTPAKDPIDIITDFIEEMECYAKLNKYTYNVFATARNAIKDIFYLFV